MAVDKFKFVSPGVFIDEIDESGVPRLPERMGPLVIGRFQKGPSNRPIRVDSFKQFVQIYGNPHDGQPSGEVWREGEMTAPTYAAYAVQAWLRNNSPCTVYRVLGEHPSNADTSVSTALAGWKTDQDLETTIGTSGGAYGLFVFPNPDNHVTGGVAASAFEGGATVVTGTLAAVWYMQDGGIVLTGSDRYGKACQAAGTLIKSTNQKFTAKIFRDGATEGNVIKQATFNFDRDSSLFVRKVFNTDPTKTNSDLVTSDVREYYWLGETFETNVSTKLAVTGTSVSSTGEFLGVILGLESAASEASFDWHDRRRNAVAAQTGWFISQDTRGETTSGFSPDSDTEKLFKVHALDSGESANRDFKISIQDIKAPTDNFNKYGTFTLVVRKHSDHDHKPEIVERYSNLNLNPGSNNYIARVIGDKHYSYDTTSKVVREHGSYANNSRLIRVEVSALVERGGGEGLRPYGVYGPAVPRTFALLSGSTAANLKTHQAADGTQGADVKSYVVASGTIPNELLIGSASVLSADTFTAKVCHSTASVHGSGLLINMGSRDDHGDISTIGVGSDTGSYSQLRSGITASINWPATRTRVSSSEGDLVLGSQAYFGYNSSIENTRRFDFENLDLLRGAPAGLNPADSISDGSELQYSWVFTLDDVKKSSDNENHAVWVSGSRADGTSYTAESGSTGVLDAGYKRFTSPLFGGFDGYDVTERDPFRNTFIESGETDRTNYAYHSLKKAIDVVSDTEYVEYDVVTMPGITRSKPTKQLVNNCEDRGDALAIIDVAGGYTPAHEAAGTAESSRVGSVSTTVTNLKNMGINSSYGCTFYPFVQIRDTVNDSVLYVPPSVVALGTFSSSQRKSAVWFAPAGFTRGGLSEGSSGLSVVGVRQRLTSDERDDLYAANINPIASFPAEGVVIFGQKTLQVTPSALDRINVRRLLIYVKKEISRIASRILFEQNVQATWDRFTGQVVPFLEGVQAGLGLTDFRVVLDSDTTTPDLVDRNIMYAKIFLKPARAIEFIALDFIITRSGASFDD